MESDTKNKKILLFVVLLFAAGGGCICLAGAWFLSYADDDQDIQIVRAREGTAFGASHTTDQCVIEAHVRSARCGVIEALCINGATDFLNACLTNVGSRDMSVCDGAPADPDIMTDSNYSGAICERYGWDPIQDGAADTVVAGLEQWCAVNR